MKLYFVIIVKEVCVFQDHKIHKTPTICMSEEVYDCRVKLLIVKLFCQQSEGADLFCIFLVSLRKIINYPFLTLSA